MIFLSKQLVLDLCNILGCSAYGAGDVSLSFNNGAETVSDLSGHTVSAVPALLCSSGLHSAEYLLSVLDAAAEKAADFNGSGGISSGNFIILRILPNSPARLTEASENGFKRFEQSYTILLEGGAS